MDIDTLNTELHTAISPESVVTKREFHSDKNSVYWLPKDKDEQDRLTGQHFCFKELLSGNMSSSVKETLDFEGGISVLDIGCGSGAWLADMSSEYPNCIYHGCDIIDTPDILQKLPHIEYAYGNVAQRLPYEDSTFEFVIMRFLFYALRADEWPTAIREAIRVTKSGGMVQFVECATVPSKDTNSICYQIMTTMNSFSAERGQLPNALYELESMALANNNIKIVQKIPIDFITNDGTLLSKKFIWAFIKGIEGTMKYIAPKLGLETKEEISDYLIELKRDMFKSGFRLKTLSLSLQKARQ
ncbi:S-adenosyl-L-methionine-dependent methyltransferase [Sporodiniella umbellata]|nr:S-adenosyl-L-methionine-dependent methyltransferase [Sporodiniella umbellata]